jgi:hypothetical protein
MPEVRSRRESSTLSSDEIPIDDDHPFRTIPTTHSDSSPKVGAFRLEWVVAFRRNQWSPSGWNRWSPSRGKRMLRRKPCLPMTSPVELGEPLEGSDDLREVTSTLSSDQEFPDLATLGRPPKVIDVYVEQIAKVL